MVRTSYILFLLLPIAATPFTDTEDFEGMRSIIEIHFLTDFFLELFQRSMGKLYNFTTPFTDQMVVVLMSQYVFIVVRVPSEVNCFQQSALHEEIQSSINSGP